MTDPQGLPAGEPLLLNMGESLLWSMDIADRIAPPVTAERRMTAAAGGRQRCIQRTDGTVGPVLAPCMGGAGIGNGNAFPEIAALCATALALLEACLLSLAVGICWLVRLYGASGYFRKLARSEG